MRTLRSVALTFGVLIVGMALGISLVKDPAAQPQALESQTPRLESSTDDGETEPLTPTSATATDLAEQPAELQSPEVAAVRFLEMTEDVVQLPPEAGAEMQRFIASENASDRLATEVSDLLTQLRTEVPEGVAVHLAPLSLRSVETTTGWDVSIWYVEVIVYGDQLAVEQWRTATYSLVDENGEWRMDDLESSDGPVPTRPASVVGWSATSLTSAIAGFDDEVLLP